MGLILDSSVAIAAERRGDTVQAFLQRIIATAGDQEAALSPVGVVELVHGIHRADTAERRARRVTDPRLSDSRGARSPQRADQFLKAITTPDMEPAFIH